RPRAGDPHGRLQQWRTLLGHRRGPRPTVGAAPRWAAWGGAAAAGPPGSRHAPRRQPQPIAGADPARVPHGHQPVARERDAGGGQVQAAVSVSGRDVLTKSYSFLKTLRKVESCQNSSLNLSPFVARKNWRRYRGSPCRCRAHRLQRRETLRDLRIPMDTIYDFRHMAIK